MKIKSFIFSIVIVLMLSIFLICILFTPIRNAIHRELKQEEIRPKIKGIIGKELPDTVENLRAVIYSVGKNDVYVDLYVTFHTDSNGCSYILKEFGGPDVKRQTSFREQYDGDRSFSLTAFRRGYHLQQECGAVLFDMDLVKRAKYDYAIPDPITGNFPEDAVTGYYICFEGEYEPEILYNYHVLVFTDRGLVYICANKKPEGFALP